MAVQRGSPAVHCLPAEVMREIFVLLPFHERHRTLPLVCRTWAAACAGPSRLWADVDADVREYSAQHGCTVDAGLLRAWLAARSSAVSTLNLRVSWVPAPIRCLNSPDEAATASLILDPLLQGGAALSALRMMLPDRTPLRGVDCSAVSAASGLTRLELLGHASADAVEAGMGALCLLQNLRVLRLGFRCRFAPRRPSELGLGLSLLGRLQHLEVACPGTDLGPVPGTLTTLTALRHLRLQEGFRPLWPLPVGLGRLPLTHLSLGGLEPISPSASRLGMWDEVQQMGDLRALELRGLDVVGFPPVAQLPLLQELTLHSCYIVGLPALPTGLLGHLGGLSALALSNCELDEVPGFVTGAPALECLNMAGNDLAGGMPAGPYLHGLRELDLSGNQFGLGIIASLAPASRLERLALDGNAALLAGARAALLGGLPALRPGGLTLPAGPAEPGHASA